MLYLYYINSLDSIFGRIKFNRKSSDPVGDPHVVVRGDILVGADDFALVSWLV